uniref:Two component regulator n=1 Tax=uncultured soil bacterium TaxID=164851 RepID=E2D2H2_9BACT|nr:two component regulator [uncultured soil bacterium]
MVLAAADGDRPRATVALHPYLRSLDVPLRVAEYLLDDTERRQSAA